jgi:rSAM/selenodomain-associated transferase 1
VSAERSEDRRVLGLFAKAPVPGQVKTRLSPPLSPEDCASLYEAMLLDVIGQHARESACELALWYWPPEARSWFELHVPGAFELRPQRGSTLGARLAFAFREHAARGCGRIVVRGTDSPTLPLARVAEAFEALDRVDLVLCPDRDGGYNLVGLRQPCDALFEIELSTGTVLEQTRSRAERLGLRTLALPAHHDVDRYGDLERIRSELTPALTPRTLAWFECRVMPTTSIRS